MKYAVVPAALLFINPAMASDEIYKSVPDTSLIVNYNDETSSCSMLGSYERGDMIRLSVQKNMKNELAFVLIFAREDWEWSNTTDIPVVYGVMNQSKIVGSYRVTLQGEGPAIGSRLESAMISDLALGDELVIVELDTKSIVSTYNIAGFDRGITIMLDCFTEKYITKSPNISM
ncbi:MAG: hypothetical protein HC836_10605 [Richelia sp. RM2_1_2]|nr:hypothetical protein [Richelia sp. RM2_1_2]